MTETTEPYKLTPVETKDLPGRILSALLEAKPQGKRLTAAQLARRFGYRNDRKVRVAIGLLIIKGYLIVSSIRKPYGYFLASSKAEVEEYVRTQHSRIRETAQTVRAVQRNAARAFSDYDQVLFVVDDDVAVHSD